MAANIPYIAEPVTEETFEDSSGADLETRHLEVEHNGEVWYVSVHQSWPDDKIAEHVAMLQGLVYGDSYRLRSKDNSGPGEYELVVIGSGV